MTFTIPESELEFRASRAGGPGGQHVNKVSTRVEVHWDVATSPSLTDQQRARLMERLGRRLDSTGVMRVVAQDYRSQLRNREAAAARLNDLVQRALHQPKPRKRTRPTGAAREARLRAKAKRAKLKTERTRSAWED